jgi:hypothetical protein
VCLPARTRHGRGRDRWIVNGSDDRSPIPTVGRFGDRAKNSGNKFGFSVSLKRGSHVTPSREGSKIPTTATKTWPALVLELFRAADRGLLCLAARLVRDGGNELPDAKCEDNAAGRAQKIPGVSADSSFAVYGRPHRWAWLWLREGRQPRIRASPLQPLMASVGPSAPPKMPKRTGTPGGILGQRLATDERPPIPTCSPLLPVGGGNVQSVSAASRAAATSARLLPRAGAGIKIYLRSFLYYLRVPLRRVRMIPGSKDRPTCHERRHGSPGNSCAWMPPHDVPNGATHHVHGSSSPVPIVPLPAELPLAVTARAAPRYRSGAVGADDLQLWTANAPSALGLARRLRQPGTIGRTILAVSPPHSAVDSETVCRPRRGAGPKARSFFFLKTVRAQPLAGRTLAPPPARARTGLWKNAKVLTKCAPTSPRADGQGLGRGCRGQGTAWSGSRQPARSGPGGQPLAGTVLAAAVRTRGAEA